MKVLLRIILLALIAFAAFFYLREQGQDSPVAPTETPSPAEITELITAPPARPFEAQEMLADGSVDEILIDKSERKMWLKSNGEIVRTYDIGLGFAPEGDKRQQGDGKTPIGRYVIDWRNPQSSYYLSLHVSYPRPDQVKQARAEGRNPGGDIMIHGQPNQSPLKGDYKIPGDWTAGCIAVSDNEMDELWRLVPNGATIEIIE